MTEDSVERYQYSAVRFVVDPSKAPRQAHRFLCTRVGTDFVLEVGYHDIAELRQAVETLREANGKPEKDVEVPLYVTDRFVMSTEAADDYVRTAEFIKGELAKVRAALKPKTTTGPSA